MLQKTRGIVINYLKYKESSIIVRIYTEELGLQSYMVNGVRSAKAKTSKIALYQPLTLLDLVVYFHKSRQQINRVSEVKCYSPFQTIPFDIKKSTVALFMAEILTKTLKEETSNPYLFSFLNDSIQTLDNQLFKSDDFHLFFLIKLSRYLGFEPSSGEEVLEQIQENKKVKIHPTQLIELKYSLNLLIEKDYFDKVVIPPDLRSELIDYLSYTLKSIYIIYFHISRLELPYKLPYSWILHYN